MTAISLGRGLKSLIPKKTTFEGEKFLFLDKILEVDIGKITPNPYQPRQSFSHEDLEELTDSIKVHGIIQPLIVTETEKGYQLVAGERRLKAAKLLDLKKVPVIVRKTTGRENLELSIVENIQRQDLNPLEKALAYKRLIEEFGLTQEEVGEKVGKSRVAITNALRLLGLPEEVKKAVTEGKITEGHAKSLVSIKDPAEQKKLFKKVLKENLTVREVEWGVKKTKRKKERLESLKVWSLEIDDDLETLREVLGTKVEIAREGKGGQLIIHYYSPSDLKEIINRITKTNE